MLDRGIFWVTNLLKLSKSICILHSRICTIMWFSSCDHSHRSQLSVLEIFIMSSMLNCIAYSWYNCRQVKFIWLVLHFTISCDSCEAVYIVYTCTNFLIVYTFSACCLHLMMIPCRLLSHPVQKYLKPMQMGLARSRYSFESVKLYILLKRILFICNWYVSTFSSGIYSELGFIFHFIFQGKFDFLANL